MAAGLSVIVIIMVILADYVYKLWIGSIVNIPFSLSLFMGLNVMLMMFTIPYVNFINGVGVITLQLVVGVCEAIINIPLSIFLAKNMNYGSTGVIMATCIANLIAFIIWPIQYKKIITNKAKGIWLK
jgi:Na+-driven multidrug efflux pump